MLIHNNSIAVDYLNMEDLALVELALRGHRDAFRHIMQRCNQRLFRVARGVLNDDYEAEDVVQEAYANAFEKLNTFRGDASLLSWMTRIVLNEAYGRLRQRRTNVDIEQIEVSLKEDNLVLLFPSKFGSEDPAATAARDQIRKLLERAIDELPESFRMVYVMREIEECSVEETAISLDIRPETVKTRLHRARRLLRIALQDKLSTTLAGVFPFLGPRCERMTEHMLKRLDSRIDTKSEPAPMKPNNI